MKIKYISDLSKDDQIENEVFVLIKSQKNVTRNGGQYIRVELADKSGTITGNIWEDNISNCEEEALAEGSVIGIYGKVEDYKGVLQLNIYSLCAINDFDMADFIAESKIDLDEMWEGFEKHIDSIENDDIKKLIKKIFDDEDRKEQFKTFPAAERVHHAFKGGLLEHVMEMLDMSEALAKYYPEADMSLVKAGIILHDIGKLTELENKKTCFSRTEEGYLVGHIIQGYEFLCSIVEDDFPHNLLIKLKHMILSHHGVLEFGSPVVPKTIEAIIVSQLDNASSKTRQYQRILHENEGSREKFSKNDHFIGTNVYLK